MIPYHSTKSDQLKFFLRDPGLKPYEILEDSPFSEAYIVCDFSLKSKRVSDIGQDCVITNDVKNVKKSTFHVNINFYGCK